jgi:hypothetical protein
MKAARAIAGGLAVAAIGTFAYVRAADEPVGYVGKGNIVVQSTIMGDTKITLGGDVAMEERGPRLRVDVLSLAIPGTSGTLSALISTQLFPPGGFTVVYDRSAGAFTVWSSSRQRFYTSASAGTQSAGQPIAASAATAIVEGGDLFSAFSFARSLKDDTAFNVSLGLAGHQTVNGHPATGMNFQYDRKTKAGADLELHGTFQFADDLDGVPVEITVAGKGGSLPDSAFRLDFSSLTKQTPPDEDFEVPAGYTRATSLGDVIGKTLPGI